ncbi:MAG: HAD family hydrolase [Mesorhizobium sp.]|nr:MAG: HAD family hydrolase [Mesorhizobium sp.]
MQPRPLLPTRPSAIIFDFDGVILDSAEIKAQAFAEIYADCGDEWSGFILDYQRQHGGISRREKFKHFDKVIVGHEPTEERLLLLSARFTDLVFRKILSAPFIPGARSLLDTARGHSRLFVVSGTPQEELVEIIHRRSLKPYFEAIIGAPITKLEAFTRILNMDIARETVLAIGDSKTECSAAVELGIPFLGIRNGPSPTDFPKEIATLPHLEGASKMLGFDIRSP